MITIRQIDHVVIRAADVKRMVAFYRDVLCCPVERVNEEQGLWQLRAGTTLIDLVDIKGRLGGGEPPDRAAPNMDHFCVQVEPWDVDTIEAHLIANGIEYGDISDRYGATGTGPSMYLKDPEGNNVELKGPATEAPDSVEG
jgi:catechol 2,3-dioxygenase-like lactoylglutathione lyase family enzyme